MSASFNEDQRMYLENPLAFWNRPDGDYLSDKPYVPVFRYYDAPCDYTVEVQYAG